ncbi:hypothetical protein AKI39_09650 [Bordetella sp. H567]|uniref:cold shock domain-containing protein n=1 Tax=Bordetella sp. H567 TaxID=1697043 RepID=UPI00081D23D4|nr:cold shock domain-containing protein [Bordetella sp. H567]AOB30898.1 hypothetical protein AKI39_09650 [Bordetella sp. H567]
MDNRYEVGTVKCFFSLKGFGFITRERGKDVFFFYKDVVAEEDMLEGAKVKFTVDQNPNGKGPVARDVHRVG